MTELLPILDDAKNILIKGGKENDADPAFAEWWAIFTKDTFSLFEIIEKENQTRQFAMTVRSLMEFAADVSFFSKYPKNIDRQKKKSEKFINSKNRFTYKDIAIESKKYKLVKYNGNKAGDLVRTEDRIKMAFSENAATLYDYLNCFTHFNIFGIRIDLNIQQAKDDSMLQERLLMIQFYPEIFEVMTTSIGNLCGIEELKHYDFSPINNLFKNVDTQWRLAQV